MEGGLSRKNPKGAGAQKNKAGLRLVSLWLGQTGGEHKEPAAGLSWDRKGPGAPHLCRSCCAECWRG